MIMDDIEEGHNALKTFLKVSLPTLKSTAQYRQSIEIKSFKNKNRTKL